MSYGLLKNFVSLFCAIRKRDVLGRAIRYCVRFSWYVFGMFFVFVFVIALNEMLLRKAFFYLGGLCFPILAVLFGFTSLLYNRSRAFPPGVTQRRSLYAAERGLQATLLFVLGLAIGLVLVAIIEAFKIDVSPVSYRVREISSGDLNFAIAPSSHIGFEVTVYILIVFPVALSFGSFFLAVQAVSHDSVKYLTTRMLMKRVRRK